MFTLPVEPSRFAVFLTVMASLAAAPGPANLFSIATGMNSYLAGIPDSLYTLFGTGYLGYTAARQWGKNTGTDK